MSIETILLVLLVVFLIGAIPVWPHSRPWGYAPSGIFTLLLVVFLVWAIAGGRPLFRSAGGDLREAGRNVAASVRDVAR
jgi:hypothetical protein